MAKQKKLTKTVTQTVTPREDKPANVTTVVVQDITVAQLYRGNQDVQSWYEAVRAAESLMFPNRRPLYQTFLDASIDLHYDAMASKRIRALKTTPFIWQGLENDKIKENLSSPWWSEFMRLIQSRIFEGTTLAEFSDDQDGLIGDVNLVPRQNVKPERGIISLDGFSYDGIRYREGIYKNYILQIGKSNELGLLTKIAPYILLKRQNFSDFARFNEMFGMPLRVYEYDPLKPGARVEVEKSAKLYGSAAYVIIPKGFAGVEFKESTSKSGTTSYDTFHKILNDEITIGILGQTLTTGTAGGKQGGSQALGRVHQDVEEEINIEDRIFASYIINYEFKKNILIPRGYPMENIKGEFKQIDELPKETRANMWIALANAGVEIAEEDFHTEFGVPMPDGRPVVVIQKPFNPADPAQQAEGEDPNDPDNPNSKTNGNQKQIDKQQRGGAGGKKLSGAADTLSRVRQYYTSSHSSKSNRSFKLSYTKDLTGVINNLIEQIHAGKIQAGDVSPELYELVSAQLYSAVEEGYGSTLGTSVSDDAMLKALRENVYTFSGFKNYQFIRQANDLLLNAGGQVKAFAAFKKDMLALNQEINVEFLRTEYNHAIATSQMASKWQDFTADQKTLPFLQYVTVGDSRVRDSHQKLDGITKLVNDPFWDSRLPPLDWNCRCTVKQLPAGTISSLDGKNLPPLKPGFGINWGKERVVFDLKKNPITEVDPSDRDKADNNFGLKLP